MYYKIKKTRREIYINYIHYVSFKKIEKKAYFLPSQVYVAP